MTERIETFHHTDEQLAEAVTRALKACEAAPLLPEERAAVLPQLVLLASQKTIYEAPPAHLLGGLVGLPGGHRH